MMNDFNLRSSRDLVLRKIYDLGAGEPYFSVEVARLSQACALTTEQLGRIVNLIESQGLLSTEGFIGSVGLSDAGQREAERLAPQSALREPPQPSAVTINASGYSVVQYAGAGSTQTVNVAVDQSRLAVLLDQAEREIATLPLNEGQRDEARGLVAGLRQAARDKLPAASLRALGAALSGVLSGAGSALGESLLGLLNITKS